MRYIYSWWGLSSQLYFIRVRRGSISTCLGGWSNSETWIRSAMKHDMSLATFAASHVSACSTQTTSLTEVLHSNVNNKFSGLSQKKQAKARLAAAISRWSCPLSYSFRWRAERDEDIYIFFIYQQMWFTCKVTLCFLCRSCPRTSHHEYVWYVWVDLRLRCEHVQVLRGRRVDTTFPLIWWLLMWRIHMKSLRREDVPGHLSGFWPTSHRNNW